MATKRTLEEKGQEQLQDDVDTGVDVTSWIGICEQLEEYYLDVYKIEKNKAKIPPTWQYYNPVRFTTNGSQGGDQRLRSLRSALKFIDANGTKRSKHQVQMHDGFIAACIRNIYKGEFQSNYMRILKDNAWDECCSEVLVCCPSVEIDRYSPPHVQNRRIVVRHLIFTVRFLVRFYRRRFGKTFAVGMFVASYAMTQPNCTTHQHTHQ